MPATKVTQAGYRLYDEAALEQQIHLLELRKGHLQNLIELACRVMKQFQKRWIVRNRRLVFRLKYQKRIDISGEISKFRAKCQSQFDNSRKRKGILRKNIIGILALFGTNDLANIPNKVYFERKIYLVKYISIDFTHNMEYIKCREVTNMSDFQSFLDKTLTQIDVEAIKEEDNEAYEYDIYREIRELVVAARGRAGLTQKELAVRSGLTQSNISNIEKGSTRPTIDSLKKIADATGRRLVIQFGDREVML